MIFSETSSVIRGVSQVQHLAKVAPVLLKMSHLTILSHAVMLCVALKGVIYRALVKHGLVLSFI